MQENPNTGWRALPPAPADYTPVFDELTKSDLFHAGRLAVKALELKGAARFVLETLVGFYGGEPITGRLLVWPSNELLAERTGISERALRYALRALINAGIIETRDSANGKRYARRAPNGQIIAAFGFDLSPIVLNRDEYSAIVARQKEQLDLRQRSFDEVTVMRRATLEVLTALEEWFPEIPQHHFRESYDRLLRRTPRRSSKQAIDPVLADWRELRRKAEEAYYSACGGKNCRQKENNNDAPDQSWNKGREENGGGKLAEPISIITLAAACPDAFGYAGTIEGERDLVREAGRLRGIFGAHRTAWDEACETLGATAAAIALFLVLQRYEDSQSGRQSAIKNPGGYFRSYIRLLEGGQATLAEDLALMRRKRAH